ncbi:ATP-binding protein [Aquabacter spiritensis]|uniref:histidine kinase n=1 Tax=Aquabacter spiritensis TaxID=933073 RepID=A0A4R3M462_9HYPH|nr:HAMP domain-containing sensor histidine kinase [Aquabacter spiritensis]TCT07606.1 signal transduction histidine kinase [Aquabacter spiritensis]
MRAQLGTGSLAFRLFLSGVVVTAAVLLVIGFVLSSLYRTGTERAFDRRLEIYLKTIVAEVAGNGPGAELPAPQALGEPLFLFPMSGWYWQVARTDPDTPRNRVSRSLVDTALPLLEASGLPDAGGIRQGYIIGPEGQRLRAVQRALDLGTDGRFVVTVAGDASEIDGEIASFNLALVGTFAVLGLAFLLIVLFQIRFGLRPLERLSRDLADVRSGKAETLDEDYPEEVGPLVREVNGLIEANREVVERARTHVGNLAHALKTPLSVLLNEAGTRDDPLAQRVRDQAGVMRDQVAHHLERARLAARVSMPVTVCDLHPLLLAMARTMEKMHRARDLAIDIRCPEDVQFRGERQDIEEMVGNLIDNACKWAHGQVEVEVFTAPPAQPFDRGFLRIVIDDDGPGLAPAKREEVGRRGRRLDESKPGSGLGLSIVQELATLYGGQLELGTAPIGGLRAELFLPAA